MTPEAHSPAPHPDLPPTLPAPFPPSRPQVRRKASDSSHHFKSDGQLRPALKASLQTRRPRSSPARKVTSPLVTSVSSCRRGVVNPVLPAQNLGQHQCSDV